MPMPHRLLLRLTLATILTYLAVTHGRAQTPNQPAPKPFSFGDLMNTLVQPRHVKLALAGAQRNWVLAAYAHHQLKDALGNVSISRPRFRNQPVPELMETMTGEPLRALEKAIAAKDAVAFDSAFGDLTRGCNNCHTALGHAFVVIRTPDASVFPDQVFSVPPVEK